MTATTTAVGCINVSVRASEDADSVTHGINCEFQRDGVESDLDISTSDLAEYDTRYTRASVSYGQ